MKLHNEWVIWEHKHLGREASDEEWSNSYQMISEFSTISEFWEIYSFIPRISEIMFDGKKFKIIEGRTIDGFSIFKKGIRPAWEDPANANGCELRMIRGIPILADMDGLWENTIIALIGQMLDTNDKICGCRVTDKSKIGKGGSNKTLYNIHIWLACTDEGVIDEVKKNIAITLADTELTRKNFKIPEFEIHPH